MRVAIIGAGFGGLCMAIRLERAGIRDYTIFEKSGGVGGTWHDNTYPGAGCDIPSHLYSFSFAKYADWSRRYPAQPEILAYLDQCADRYGLRPHLRLNTEVTALTYQDGRWRVSTAANPEGEIFDVAVSAVGQLNRPRIPEISGKFDGPSFHSARWQHHDLTGRRVAVIGAGSSAAQLIPEVAATAAHVDVFLRTPNWVLPKADAEFGPLLRTAFRFVPPLQRAYRSWLYHYAETAFFPAFAGGWSSGLLRSRALAHLKAAVPDPELRGKLTPDYPVGCKRVIIDSRFYPALTRPNVSVITDGIDRLTGTGLRTADGAEHPADAIVYATGFETTGFLLPVRVTGRDGQDLHQQWEEGAEAYLGMAVPHFPNLFLLYGPNTNLGHSSIVFMIECQTRYIMGCLGLIGSRGPMEVRAEAMDRWRRALDEAMRAMVWQAGCASWYKTASGRVTNNWPRPMSMYRRITRRPDPAAYRFAPAG
ncbi:4-hydroxyacetophenone monooxygenase [Acrocarpospora corrugata]|uniref:4-hydroxyacetophenone monooxygenase n=1 Tax=Acrocarpospora corrugata TaxID=35763 RepID=A0A5M3VUS3_9ACTN|nr:NAD(P)/FAD-dependent oxidoreductase [Acrocarpospora corrugata]GER98490.1 4-hydroxyacetophenone monooxygenase [Acrocarpospora corrugata]